MHLPLGGASPWLWPCWAPRPELEDCGQRSVCVSFPAFVFRSGWQQCGRPQLSGTACSIAGEEALLTPTTLCWLCFPAKSQHGENGISPCGQGSSVPKGGDRETVGNVVRMARAAAKLSLNAACSRVVGDGRVHNTTFGGIHGRCPSLGSMPLLCWAVLLFLESASQELPPEMLLWLLETEAEALARSRACRAVGLPAVINPARCTQTKWPNAPFLHAPPQRPSHPEHLAQPCWVPTQTPILKGLPRLSCCDQSMHSTQPSCCVLLTNTETHVG